MTEELRKCPSCDRLWDRPTCPVHGTANIIVDRPITGAGLLSEGYTISDRYVIQRLIGRGGFGAVFAARHTGTGQEVAIKVLTRDTTDEKALKFFHQEAQVTSGLRHPNTIRVFDFGKDKAGFLYIAMELLEGQSLGQELRKRGAQGKVFSEAEAVEIGIGVTKSLAEAHAAGLIHRDLKPDNIFLHQVEGDGPIVKVLDFGIAKLVDHQHTSIRGTPSYMSPEQVKGETLDGRSDLYALGVILFTLVTGQLPFFNKDLVETLRQQVRQRAPDIRTCAKTRVSDVFAETVNALLSKSPDDRPSDALALRAMLEQCTGAPQTTPLNISETPQFIAPDQDTIPVDTATVSLSAPNKAPAPTGHPSRMLLRILVAGVMIGLLSVSVWILAKRPQAPNAAANAPVPKKTAPPATIQNPPEPPSSITAARPSAPTLEVSKPKAPTSEPPKPAVSKTRKGTKRSSRGTKRRRKKRQPPPPPVPAPPPEPPPPVEKPSVLKRKI